MYVPFLFTLIIMMSATGCNSSGESKDSSATAAEQTGSDNKSGSLTVAAARKFLEADTANKGKEVTVTAYSWGSQNRMGGTIGLNLGDKKLEGFQQASFTCIFPADQEAKIKAIAKDAQVTVTGTISKGDGGIQLDNCKLAD